MIKVGEIVVIAGENYRVEKTPAKSISCAICDVTQCLLNGGIQNLKSKHDAYTCEDLIGLRRHFKKVQDEGQVSSELLTQTA